MNGSLIRSRQWTRASAHPGDDHESAEKSGGRVEEATGVNKENEEKKGEGGKKKAK